MNGIVRLTGDEPGGSLGESQFSRDIVLAANGLLERAGALMLVLRGRELMLKLVSALMAAVSAATPAVAQQLPAVTQQTQNIKRIPLQRFDVPGMSFETVIGMAEIGP